MEDVTLENLTQRLDRLERAQRRWQLVSLILLFLVAGIPPVAYSVFRSPTVEAQNFIVKDQNGKVRAELALEQGQPSLMLADKRGIPRAVYGAGDDGESFLAFFADGLVRARLATKPDGPVQLTLHHDSKGKPRVDLGVDIDGSPYLRLSDKDGKVIWKAP